MENKSFVGDWELVTDTIPGLPENGQPLSLEERVKFAAVAVKLALKTDLIFLGEALQHINMISPSEAYPGNYIVGKFEPSEDAMLGECLGSTDNLAYVEILGFLGNLDRWSVLKQKRMGYRLLGKVSLGGYDYEN